MDSLITIILLFFIHANSAFPTCLFQETYDTNYKRLFIISQFSARNQFFFFIMVSFFNITLHYFPIVSEANILAIVHQSESCTMVMREERIVGHTLSLNLNYPSLSTSTDHRLQQWQVASQSGEVQQVFFLAKTNRYFNSSSGLWSIDKEPLVCLGSLIHHVRPGGTSHRPSLSPTDIEVARQTKTRSMQDSFLIFANLRGRRKRFFKMKAYKNVGADDQVSSAA